MVKVNKPKNPAKFYLNYTGNRNVLIEAYSRFSKINIDFDKEIENHNEPLSAKIKLHSNEEIVIGIISRNVYSFKGVWTKNENAGINLYQIIVANNFTYIKGAINIDIELGGEIITDTYKFKIFTVGNLINSYIIKNEIECENFL